MSNKHILCLLIWFFTGCTLTIRADDKTEKRVGEGDAWEFGNFGEKAGGEVNVKKNKMTFTTRNTRHCFFESDSYSFAYIDQHFSYDDCSRSVITVKIDKFPMGSAGIMIRSGLNTDASNAHLEVSSTGDLLLFNRKADGVFTTYKRIGKVDFPVEIKLTRQGNIFAGFYKDKSGKWIKGPVVIAEVGTDQKIGFYACSGTDSQIGYSIDNEKEMQVTFSDWKILYEENYIPEEKNYTDTMPVKERTLLRDNFNDGSMSNGPESITNPIWEGIKYAEMPKDTDGSRYWKKRGDGIYYLGDKKWADYQVSIDFSFDRESPPAGEFSMQFRYQHISVYEKLLRYYNVGFRNRNKLFFEKNDAGKIVMTKEVVIPDYMDASRHNLTVKFLDKKYEVYLDNKLLIEGADEKQPITYGNIAFNFSDISMNIYQLEALKINDPINGSDDNYLLDYFDIPIPEYMEKYGYPQGR